MAHVFELDGQDHAVWLVPQGDRWRMTAEGGSASVSLTRQAGDAWTLTLDGHQQTVAAVVAGDIVHIQIEGQAYALRYRDPVDLHATEGDADSVDVVRAPMPGTVLSVKVAPGKAVKTGDTLLVIESMKLEMAIKAGHDGVTETVHVAAGQTIDRDATLVTVRRNEV